MTAPVRKRVQRASFTTTLTWGAVEAPVAAYKTTGDPPEAQFETYRPPVEPQEAEAAPVMVGSQLYVPAPEPEGPGDPLVQEETEKADPGEAFAAALKASEPSERPKPERPRKGIYQLDGSFLDLTDRLDAIRDATALDRLKIVGFVHRTKVPRDRIQGSYYLAADGELAGSAKVIQLLRYAMHKIERVAVVKGMKTSKQFMGVLVPGPGGTVEILELAFSRQVRNPNTKCVAHLAAEVTEREMNLALELAEEMKDTVSTIDEIDDDAMVLREKLKAAAEAGEVDEWVDPRPPTEAEFADLEAALEVSVRHEDY